jgi:hypothetical protein
VDKTNPANEAEGRNLGRAMAGTMRYITMSKANRVRAHRRTPYSLLLTRSLPQSTEIGLFAQCTHVTSNAVGLLMKYALNLPSDPTFPGLGLRRVQWTCDSGNKPSLATAKRLEFQFEGTLRWLWILPEASSSGEQPREDDPAKGNGGTTTISVFAGMIGRGSGELLCIIIWIVGCKYKNPHASVPYSLCRLIPQALHRLSATCFPDSNALPVAKSQKQDGGSWRQTHFMLYTTSRTK